MSCDQVRNDLSAYLEREVATADRNAIEAHLAVCTACQGELDYLRLLVGGLRSLPAARPPADFAAKVMARWAAERDQPVSTASDTTAPRLALVASMPAPASGSLPQGRGVRTPAPRGEQPVRSPYAVKPLYGLVAALFAVIFAVGLFTGKSYYGPTAVKTAGLVPNLGEVADQLKQALDLRVVPAALPAAAATASASPNECCGVTNAWNATHLQMVVRSPLQREQLEQVEIAVWVPQNVRVAFAESEYSSGQLLLIPVRVGDDGQWRAQMRWRALTPGRFDAWVETRLGGLYQHRPIVFNAVGP